MSRSWTKCAGKSYMEPVCPVIVTSNVLLRAQVARKAGNRLLRCPKKSTKAAHPVGFREVKLILANNSRTRSGKNPAKLTVTSADYGIQYRCHPLQQLDKDAVLPDTLTEVLCQKGIRSYRPIRDNCPFPGEFRLLPGESRQQRTASRVGLSESYVFSTKSQTLWMAIRLCVTDCNSVYICGTLFAAVYSEYSGIRFTCLHKTADQTRKRRIFRIRRLVM